MSEVKILESVDVLIEFAVSSEGPQVLVLSQSGLIISKILTSSIGRMSITRALP